MSLQDILNKRYGGESSGRDVSSSFQSKIAERYNPLVNYRKQQNERIRKQENFDNAQKQGIQARQDFENVNSSILNRINTFFGRGVSAPGEVKQTFGESPLSKAISGETTKTYEDIFLQGQKDRDTQSQITRNSEYIKTAVRRKKENPQKAEFYDNFIQQRLEENKTLADQAGGEIAKKTTGQLIGQSLGTAAELAQLIPGAGGFTAVGRQALKSAAGKGILQGSKLLSKQGAKNLLTNQAVVENALYGGVMGTGQGLQEQKGTLGTIGSGVAGTAFGGALGVSIPAGANMAGKVVNKILDKLIVKRVAKRATLEIEKELGKLSSDELKLVKESIDSGGTKDNAISNIKELRLADKEMDMALSFDTPVDVPKVKAITEAPEPPKRSVETIKPETPVKPPVKEITPVKPPIKEAGGAKEAIAKGLTEDEWVKGQPKLYHAGTADIAEISMRKSNFQGTFYMSESPTYAKSFGGSKSALNEISLDKGAKMADLRTPSQDIVSSIEAKISAKPTGKILEITKPDGSVLKIPELKGGKINAVHSTDAIIKGIRDGKAYFAEMPEVKAALKELGYDGMITQESKFGANYGVWNKNVLKTTAQLRAEYQAAKGVKKVEPKVEASKAKEIPTLKVETPSNKPIKRESITAKKMNKRLNGVDELSTKYDVVNLKKEIDEASSLIEKNKTKAVKTVFSDTGSNTQKVAIATELFEKAVVDGDVKTQSLLFDRIKKLSTETAQALNMFKALTVTNPHFKYMKEVVNLRLDKIKVSGEDITKAINTKTEPIVASITKATKSRLKIVNAQKLLDKLIC